MGITDDYLNSQELSGEDRASQRRDEWKRMSEVDKWYFILNLDKKQEIDYIVSEWMWNEMTKFCEYHLTNWLLKNDKSKVLEILEQSHLNPIAKYAGEEG